VYLRLADHGVIPDNEVNEEGDFVHYLSIYISLNLKLELFLCKSFDDVACPNEL
jgi:hypothetical protein